MSVSLNEKKFFLQWCLKNLRFSRQEIYWLLNYLCEHPMLLENIHFVEGARFCSRGLTIEEKNVNLPIYLVLDNKEFTDSTQIFHEIRFHWKKPLFMEIKFTNAWTVPEYVGVLEDNPENSWNENLDPEISKKVNESLEKIAQEDNVNLLKKQIDQALEKGEEEKFISLSEQLKILMKQ